MEIDAIGQCVQALYAGSIGTVNGIIYQYYGGKLSACDKYGYTLNSRPCPCLGDATNVLRQFVADTEQKL